MLWIGTSGFQYPEWKGTFYPEGLSTAKMLPFYAGHFATTEINYSFFRIPSEKTLQGWAAATPETFKFSLKAPRRITHQLKLKDAGESVERFAGAIGELGAKLGVALFQLPPSLKKDLALFDAFLDVVPHGLRAAVEFRHDSWFDDAVYERLKAKNLALCVADSEDLSTPPIATASYGYFRLRDEGYDAAAIERWAEIIRPQLASHSDTFVYFKHEEKGTGPVFAKQLAGILS